jgi:hypothetical protein
MFIVFLTDQTLLLFVFWNKVTDTAINVVCVHEFIASYILPTPHYKFMSYYCNGKCELKVEILPLKSMDDCSKKIH